VALLESVRLDDEALLGFFEFPCRTFGQFRSVERHPGRGALRVIAEDVRFVKAGKLGA
jgi:hypothetical protein